MGDYNNNSVQESWNMATATLQRLNNLLIQSSMFAQSGNLTGWFRVIMDIRRNLYPFMEDAEFKEIESKLNALPLGWNNFGQVQPKHYAVVNKTFDEVYMIFINVMKSKGLLMPKSKDANRAVIGG
jgi:hypothetical protein